MPARPLRLPARQEDRGARRRGDRRPPLSVAEGRSRRQPQLRFVLEDRPRTRHDQDGRLGRLRGSWTEGPTMPAGSLLTRSAEVIDEDLDADGDQHQAAEAFSPDPEAPSETRPEHSSQRTQNGCNDPDDDTRHPDGHVQKG